MFENLKVVRKNAGVTCEKMAEILNLKTKSAYSKKENGRVPFTLEEAKTVADSFGTTIDDLFFTSRVS